MTRTRIVWLALFGLFMGIFGSAGSWAQEPSSDEAAAEETEMPEQTYPNLKIGGFTDINFGVSDSPGQLSNGGFSEGQFVLHFTSELSSRLSFFGELSLTARNAGVFTPTVERSIIKYDHNNMIKLSFGRYHAPINYWNTAFHHGQWLQTSISRPDMTRFGGALIPVHFVGGLLEGSVPAHGWNLNYQLGVGNGREQTITQGGDAFDFNNNRALLATVFVRPDRFYPLQVGGSVYRDKLTIGTTPATTRNHREMITAAHVAWTRERPEVIAEYANIDHRDLLTNRTSNSHAYYVQVAYRLPWWDEKYKPYARYENIKTDLLDPVYTSTMFSRKGYLLGVRWDFAELLAIKGEYRRQRTTSVTQEPYVNSFNAQISYAF